MGGGLKEGGLWRGCAHACVSHHPWLTALRPTGDAGRTTTRRSGRRCCTPRPRTPSRRRSPASTTSTRRLSPPAGSFVWPGPPEPMADDREPPHSSGGCLQKRRGAAEPRAPPHQKSVALHKASVVSTTPQLACWGALVASCQLWLSRESTARSRATRIAGPPLILWPSGLSTTFGHQARRPRLQRDPEEGWQRVGSLCSLGGLGVRRGATQGVGRGCVGARCSPMCIRVVAFVK